jgi:pseudouridine-5'-monophosphatase
MPARAFLQKPRPLSDSYYIVRLNELEWIHFPTSLPLPGIEQLLETLSTATTLGGGPLEIAQETSYASPSFILKTSHLQGLFKYFPVSQQLRGDDPRIPPGCGKPAPDIYLVALETINARLRGEGVREVLPGECLVFEDSVLGVQSARRAGTRVVWVPHPDSWRNL